MDNIPENKFNKNGAKSQVGYLPPVFQTAIIKLSVINTEKYPKCKNSKLYGSVIVVKVSSIKNLNLKL
jgi:hypothetical protein